MLAPLTQFYCDTCHEIIGAPNEGWLEWISEPNPSTGFRNINSFRIVHQFHFSPLNKTSMEGCYQHGKRVGRADNHLNAVIDDGRANRYMLSFLDPGSYHLPSYPGCPITDMRNYVETFRRLTFPHYEEARLYWPKAIGDGFIGDENEISIFNSEFLKSLIRRYSKHE